MKCFIKFFLLITITTNLSFAQWEQLGTDNGLPSYSLKVNTIGTINGNVIISTVSEGLFLSEDNGSTWRRPSGNYPAEGYFNGSATLNGKIFAGSAWNGIGVLSSGDDGESWDTLSNGLDGSLGITANTILGAFNGILFLGASNFYISTDEGASWQVSSNGLPAGGTIYDVAYDSTNYYCSYKKVYKSTDGLNWAITDNTDLPFTAITDLICSGSNVIAVAQNNGVYYSTDEGNTWAPVNGLSGNDFSSMRDLFTWERKIYAVTAGKVYHSSDDGLTWALVQETGIQPNGTTCLNATSTHLFAGKNTSTSGSIWRYALTTSVEKDEELAKYYSLSQNYPNPFNPSTTIRFSIPENGFVSLKVFDVLGNEITTLVNEELNAGSYSAEFNTVNVIRNLASGIYFYRLKSNHFTQTKKLLLLK